MDYLEQCKVCNDEGFIPCPDCDGFDQRCPTCHGYGELPCPECNFEEEEEGNINWEQDFDPGKEPIPQPVHEVKSGTLVVHPADPSTDFLKVIYAGKGYDVLNQYQGTLNAILPQYQRIIMLGHGWVGGLFTMGKIGVGWYAVGDEHVDALKGKNNVYIWCNAQTFVRHHGLSGFSTGMFVSEVAEANMFGIQTTQEAVTRSNNLFAQVMSTCIDNPTLAAVLKGYDGDDPVIQFNRDQMRGINLVSRW